MPIATLVATKILRARYKHVMARCSRRAPGCSPELIEKYELVRIDWECHRAQDGVLRLARIAETLGDELIEISKVVVYMRAPLAPVELKGRQQAQFKLGEDAERAERYAHRSDESGRLIG